MNKFEYLAFRRKVVLIDEYLYYGLLFFTYFYLQHMMFFILVGVVGGPMVYLGYYYLEQLENAMRIYDSNTYRIKN